MSPSLIGRCGGGGGSTFDIEYVVDGGTGSIPANTAGSVKFAHGGGSALLNYSTNTAPTVVADGVYVFEFGFGYEVTFPATVPMFYAAHFSNGGTYNFFRSVGPFWRTATASGVPLITPPVSPPFTVTNKLLAGESFAMEIYNEDSSAHGFLFQDAILVKIG